MNRRFFRSFFYSVLVALMVMQPLFVFAQNDVAPNPNIPPQNQNVVVNNIGDIVWQDQNSDSNRDLGEPGIGGVTVHLHRANIINRPSADVVATAVTSDTGHYLFTNDPAEEGNGSDHIIYTPALENGEWFVRFDEAPGSFTEQRGENVAAQDGWSSKITLFGSDLTVDAGLRAELSDLRVERLRLFDDDSRQEIEVVNDSSYTAAGGFTVAWYAFGEENRQLHVERMVFVDDVGPGESVVLNSTVQIPEGTTVIQASVDVDNDIEESNEENNNWGRTYPFLSIFGRAIGFITEFVNNNPPEERDEPELDIEFNFPNLTVAYASIQGDDGNIVLGIENTGDIRWEGRPVVKLIWRQGPIRVLGDEVFTLNQMTLAPGDRSRPQEIEIDRPLEGALSIVLEVDPNDTVVETNEEDNRWSAIIPRPDLIVTEINFNDEEEPVFTYRNNGPGYLYADEIWSRHQFIDGRGEVIGIDRDGRFPITGLAAGGEFLYDPGGFPERVAKQIRVVLDPDNQIREFDEDNNELFMDVPLPDVFIEQVNFDDNGHPTIFVARDDAPLHDNVFFQWKWLDSEGNRVAGPQQFVAPPDQFNNDNLFLFRHRELPEGIGGATHLEIVADPLERIDESNEENNRLLFEFPNFDLIPDGIAVNDNNELEIFVKNIGATGAEHPGAQYRFYDDNNEYIRIDTAGRSLPTETLFPQESIRIETGETIPAQAATVEITSFSPSGGESDENNNVERYPINLPDLELREVHIAQESGRVTATILNTGGRTAESIGGVGFKVNYFDAENNLLRHTGYNAGGLNGPSAVAVGQEVVIEDIITPPPSAVRAEAVVDFISPFAQDQVHGKVVEDNENNNTGLVNIGFADLRILSMQVDEQSGYPAFTLENNSRSHTRSRLSYQWEWLDADRRRLGLRQYTIPNFRFEPNERVDVRERTEAPPEGTRYVRIEVDYTNDEFELDEDNNVREFSYLPDLVPVGIDASPLNDTTEFVVENRGAANLGSTFVIRYDWLDEQGESLDSGIIRVNRNLEGGEVYRHRELLSPPREAHQARIFLDPTNLIREGDEQNNRETFTFSQRPDWIIDRITVDPRDHTPNVTVKNVGAARNSVGIGLEWYRLDANRNRQGLKRSTGIPSARLNPGEERTISHSEGLLDGTVYYEFTVDPANHQPESNETNNTFLYEVPFADLVVRDVSFPSLDEMQVVLANEGEIDAISFDEGHGFTYFASFFDEEGEYTNRNITGRALHGVTIPPGEVHTSSLSLERVDVARTVSYEIRIDPPRDVRPYGWVRESNENNNTYTGFMPLADLVVEDVLFEDGEIDVVIANRGDLEAISMQNGHGFNYRVRFYDENDEVTNRRVMARALHGVRIPAGETHTDRLPFDIPEGSVSMTVEVDKPYPQWPRGRVKESNEDNNISTFSVPGPDLVITDIYINPVTRFPLVRMLNQGEGDAVASTALLQWLTRDGDILGESGVLFAGAFGGVAVQAESNIPAPIGSYEVRVVADAGNVVYEEDEENNEWREVLPLPDFVIDNVDVQTGGLGSMSITARNQGTETSSVPDITVIWMDERGNPVDEITVPALARRENIEPGNDIDYRIRHQPPLSARYAHVGIDYYNDYLELDEVNNFTDVMPDFFILSMDLTETAQVETITFGNSGNLGVMGDLHFILDWLDREDNVVASEEHVIREEDVRRSLEAGGSLSVNMEPTRPPTSVGLQIVVDTERAYLEMNENNNRGLWTISPYVDERPDMAVQVVTFDVFDRRPTVRIVNQGLSDAQSPNLQPSAHWAWHNAEGEQLDGGAMPMPDLRADETFVYRADEFTEPPRGAVRFQFTVDPFFAIDESNETNNQHRVDLTLPDLTIDELTFDPDTRRPIVTIKNVGAARAILPQHNIWYSYQDDEGEQALPPYQANVGPIDLNSDATYTLPRGDMFDPPSDTNAMRLHIDWGDQLREANEFNNVRIVRSFPRSDLAVQWVTVDDDRATIALENIGGQTLSLEELWISVEQQDRQHSRLSRHTLYERPSHLRPGDTLEYTTSISPQTERLSIRATARDEGGHRVIAEDDMDNNVWEGPVIREDTNEEELIEEDAEDVQDGGEGQEEEEGGYGEGDDEGDREEDNEEATPRLLPGNPLYLFKKAGREVQLRLTRDTERRLALRHRFAKEKQQEVRQLVMKGDVFGAEKHLQRIAKDNDKLRLETKKLSGVLFEKKAAFTKQLFTRQVKQQALFDAVKQGLPPGETKVLETTQTKELVRIGSLLPDLGDKKRIKQTIRQSLDNNGSPFKQVKQLALLKDLKEAAPEEVKVAFADVEQKKKTVFVKQIEQLPKEQLPLFKKYTKEVSKKEPTVVKVLDDVVKRVEKPEVKEVLLTVKKDLDLVIKQAKEEERTLVEEQKAKEAAQQEKENNVEEAKKAEQERLEKERLEKEQAEKDAKEAEETKEKEVKEDDAVDDDEAKKKQAEQDRLEKERLEKEQAEKEAEQQRLDQEAKDLAEKEALLEKERLEKEQADKEAEQERLDQEAKDLAEKEALLEKERLEKERLEKEAEEAKKKAEDDAAAKAEQERLEKERLEKEQADKEAQEAEEARKAEEERKAKEAEEAAKKAEEEAAAAALSDLAVTSLLIDPSVPASSDLVTFFASIKNIGKGDAESVSVQLTIDEQSDGKIDSSQEQKVAALRSGVAASVSWAKIWKAPSGKHTLTLCIDPAKAQKEESTGNNCEQIVISVK